ncbi:MAG: recombinase family protein [Oscillospiraceae bacterium]|nr:recombinase family protein [Oscillospiraceae bacterium]
MSGNLKAHYIPAIPKREKRVGIYCRVSTNSSEQLHTLAAQVSHLTRLTATMPQYLLTDVYMDIATSKTGSSRKEFNRTVEDCKSNKLDMILTKNKIRGDHENDIRYYRKFSV